MVSGAKPGVGHVLQFLRDPIGLLERSYKEQGEIFSLRLGNKLGVVMIGPEHNRFFFNQPESLLSIKAAYPFLEKMFYEGFFWFGDEYAQQLSLLESSFHHNDEHVGIMEDETRALIATLGEEGEFDVAERLGPLVMRIAAHVFLGKDLGLLFGYDFFGEFDRFSGGMEPVLPTWVPIPRLIRSHKARRRLNEQLGLLVDARREKPVDPPDFLQSLVDAQYNEAGPVPKHVVVNLALLLLWTGEYTVTGQLAWGLIDLLSHPDYRKLVLEEQEQVFGDAVGVTPAHLARLEYLERALLESERLHPVVHILMRAAVESFEYAGYAIPKDTMVFTAACVSHRLAEVFDEPDRYLPDRWLSEPDPHHSPKLIGFGGGRHLCRGMEFAFMEMKVVLSLLLQHLDLELVDPHPRPAPGSKLKGPDSPCRVRYRRRF
jgi:sterol 14-demethylase